MASNVEVPPYADKLVFAADLLNHVIISTRPTFANKTMNIVNRAELFRDFVYNGFNSTMRRAVESIDTIQDNSARKVFFNLMKLKKVNREGLTEYARIYRESHFADGFQARPFLKYCVRIANLAGYFISYGVNDAPDFAVDLIIQALPEGVMSAETWDQINEAAQSYELIGNDYFREPTPSDSDSESTHSSPGENEETSYNAANMYASGSSTDV